MGTGVCGKEGGSKDYDVWLDSQGNPMPWISQTVYNKGQDIQVDVKITAHHYGHFTMSACPMGRASTQECFNANSLEFVEDTKYGMPKDENYPERAMLWGDGDELSYKFKLPDNIAGEQVLLQWIYWTANSCNYDGYQEYFNTHQTPASAKGNWSPALSGCGPIENIPMIRSGTVIAEIFVNCAEVSVSGESGPINPPPVPPPTTPVTDAPIVAPTNPPVVDPTIKPTNPPVVVPTNPPVVAPTFPPVSNNGNGCCSMDFKTCATWGNESRETCLALGSMTWLENGALENNTCLAKDSACTDNIHSCCPGLMCEGNECTCSVRSQQHVNC